MTFMVTFRIEATPVGKGRPRFTRIGTFVRTYNDKKTVDFEDLVRVQAMNAMGMSEPLETPVEAFLYFTLPIPQSYSKKRSEACLSGFERPSKRPDLDNLVKAVLDGMNGVIFKDDCQIVSIHATKTYGTSPGVEILVKEDVR
jgi:Holliday junction resolvase RusA-like endonuclease